jgi:ADP-heptose:LPS heptosyltransferase/archaellum component FlaC
MRILATNPDTIGDVVLREPLYRALREAGHELTLMVQPLVAPLVPLIAPGAEVIEIDVNAYGPALTPDSAELDDLAARAIDAKPDLLLIAPFQWTPLDARIARALEGVGAVALDGVAFVHPDLGQAATWSVDVDRLVAVDVDAPEVAKNKKLAAAVLSRAVKLGDPRIEPTEDQLAGADGVLTGSNLESDSYWVACAGHPEHAAVRNWPLESWSSLLAGWAERHDRRFLLIGAADERATSRRVIKGMGSARDHAAEWYGAEPNDLDTLVGLIARSRGYVGRDTGPMHLAAALAKPVLGVFGAGTWPRFTPAVDPSIALTVGVPTAGCGWDSKVDSAYGIEEVPLDMVAKAADDLEAGKLKRRTKRVAPASEALLRQIARDSVWAVRDIRVRARTQRARADELERQVKEHSATMKAMTEQSTRQAAAITSELERAKGAIRDLEKRLSAAGAERDKAQIQSAKLEERLNGLRERVTDAQTRAGAAEQRAEQRAEQLGAVRTEIGVLKTTLSARSEQIEQLKARLADPDSPKVNQLRDQIAQLTSQVEQLTEERDELSRMAESTQSKEQQVESTLETARARIGRMQDELDDTLRRFERAQSEQKTLSALSRQQAKELIVVRKRLDELLASRWRKLGQRIGVAMVLPWEQERANGKKE